MKTRYTGFTSFKLMYDAEAMTPQELKFKSSRLENNLDPEANEPAYKDFLEDDIVKALNAIIRYQEATKAWRDKSVKIKEFEEGDLVLIQTTRTQAKWKRELKWEGPYIVSKKTSTYAYRLTNQTCVQLEHNWSVDNLRKFFV